MGYFLEFQLNNDKVGAFFNEKTRLKKYIAQVKALQPGLEQSGESIGISIEAANEALKDYSHWIHCMNDKFEDGEIGEREVKRYRAIYRRMTNSFGKIINFLEKHGFEEDIVFHGKWHKYN